MYNRSLYKGDYEDFCANNIDNMESNNSIIRKLNQGGIHDNRILNKNSMYYSNDISGNQSTINNHILNLNSRVSNGYYDHYNGNIDNNNLNNNNNLNSIDGNLDIINGDINLNQSLWGWETYTSYNMIGLFSSYTNNRRIRPFITSIYCDPFYELLWLGWTNGFLSSFRFPHCNRYTAFPVGIADSIYNNGLIRDNVIYVGFPSSSHIYTVTNSGIGIYSRGGAPISSYSGRILTNDKMTNKILCSDSTRYQSYLVNNSLTIGIGTNRGVSILDLQELRSIHNIPYNGSITCIKSSINSSNFIVGGTNMLGIADTRLPRLGHTIQINSSTQSNNETIVSGLAVNEYTVAIITSTICNKKITSEDLLNSVGGICGLPVLDLIRIHPGEVSTSPEMMIFKKNLDLSNMMRDTIVRLYDIRKFRPRKNISFTPGPINISWNDNSMSISTGSNNNTEFDDLYIIGNNGQWQIYHSNIDQMEFYATPSVPLSNLSFSSSNNYLVLGDTSGSIHTMQRPHSNRSHSNTSNNKMDQRQINNSTNGNISGSSINNIVSSNNSNFNHSFSIYQSYPLPNLNLPNVNINNGLNRQGNVSLYNYTYIKSIQALIGIASNPVTKPLTHNIGHSNIPNLTVALRYLQGRPVVAYDSLNIVGIPPIIEKLPNGKINIRDDELLSFKNKFDVEEIRRIQSNYGWNRFKITDELPPGISIIKTRSFSKSIDSSNNFEHSNLFKSAASILNNIDNNNETKQFHIMESLMFSLDYIKEIRPEVDHFKLKNLEFRMIDFVKVAMNPDPNKYKNNNLLYGLPLLCVGGAFPIWFYRKKKSNHSNNVIFGSVDGSIVKNLSFVPSRFQYKPRLNTNRREKTKNRRNNNESVNNNNGIFSNSILSTPIIGAIQVNNVQYTQNISINDSQILSKIEDDLNNIQEEIISIELDNDTLDFTQPFFMFFSFLPKLSFEILISHIPNCSMEFCIACELVHLTFMIYSCRNNKNKNKSSDIFPCVNMNSIYTLNILRTIRHLPDAKQLGIDSEENNMSFNGTNVSLDEQFNGMKIGIDSLNYLPQIVFNQIRKTEIFWKFFIEHLRKCMKRINQNDNENNLININPNLDSIIDQLFGIEITTISSCVQSKHTFKSNQLLSSIDISNNHMIQSNIGKNNDHSFNNLKEDASINPQNRKKIERFLQALNSNLLRIIAGRTFCKECSTLTACQHVRCITRLPKILVLSCNIHTTKHWNDYGGITFEEYDDFIKKNANNSNMYENPQAIYSIPWEIRFSKFRKAFNSQNTNNETNGIDIIQVEKSGIFNSNNRDISKNNENIQEYELIAIIFGVYQGSTIQLPSGTHFCMYVKQNLLFNDRNSSKDRWYLINGSTVQQVNNRNEIINFSTSWKLPTFLFYYDKNDKFDEYLFENFPCLDFNIDPGNKENNVETIVLHGVKIRIPWKYPKEIHDHVIQQLDSIINLFKTEKNLSENPNSNQILNQTPFTDEELSNLCHNYFVRYPFSKGLLKNISDKDSNLSTNQDDQQITKNHSDFINNSPMIVALDSEYVALAVEQSVVRSDGTKEVLKKSQLSLARVSIVRCGNISLTENNDNLDIDSQNGLIMDHYVSYGSNSQQPRDYLTRYSGVKPGDLDPKTSSHFLTSKACILKKLQFLVDAGVVFIGHSLPSDFKIINIYVPPFQIIDTVEIYRLPDERYISLKFLAKFVLNKNIQIEVHDSIVDAKIAFELFLKYLNLKKNNTWNDFLNHLYSKGHSVDWKIEALESSVIENV